MDTFLSGFMCGLFIAVLTLIGGYLWGAREPGHTRTGREAPTDTEKSLLEQQIDEIMKQHW